MDFETVTDLEVGARVRLTEGSYECTGIVHKFNKKSIWLKNCVDVKSGHKRSGIDVFSAKNVSDVRTVSDDSSSSPSRHLRPRLVSHEEQNSSESEPPSEKAEKSSVNVQASTSVEYDDKPAKPFASTPSFVKLKAKRGNYDFTKVDRRNRGQNSHLKELQTLNMEQILSQVQLKDPSHPIELDDRRGKPKLIDYPNQNATHLEDNLADGKFQKKFSMRNVEEFTIARSFFWEDSETPAPLDFFPSKYYILDETSSEEDFMIAFDEIHRCKNFGLALEGKSIGRKGELSLIAISTPDAVYLFDYQSMGMDIFEMGLRELLNDGSSTKVMHDSRLPSDMLHHQFGVTLTNVYDTLAAYTCFATWSIYGNVLPYYPVSYNHVVRCFYGVDTRHLFFPHYRANARDQDTAVWLNRPLELRLEAGAVANVSYLLDLQQATTRCMNEPFHRTTQYMLDSIRNAEELDAEISSLSPETLPSNLSRVLPNFTPDKHFSVARGKGLLDLQKGKEGEVWRIHNNICQSDNNVIFSRDCMHQNRPNNKE